jgi:hypothetical protein
MTTLARLVGGPLHNERMVLRGSTLIVPVDGMSRAPKQKGGRRIGFLHCEYTRSKIEINGETIYRFSSGYYEPKTR